MARRCTCPPPPPPLAACRPVCYRMEMIHGKALYVPPPPPPTSCCLSSSLLQNGDDPWQGAVRVPPPTSCCLSSSLLQNEDDPWQGTVRAPPPPPLAACRPVCYRMKMTHGKALYVPPPHLLLLVVQFVTEWR